MSTTRTFAVGGILAVAVGGVAAVPASAAPAVTSTQTISSQWASGFCADVKVSTTSTSAVTWTVPVKVSGGTITSIWNGKKVVSGDHFNVSGESWNRTVTAAAPTAFGYCASGRPGSASTPSPTPTTTSSPTPTATATPSPTPTPTATATPTQTPTPSTTAAGSGGVQLSYAVSPWSGGGTVNVTVKNTGPAITSWRVDVPWSVSVSSVWSGVDHSSGGHLNVSNETWNGSLATGASATFGASVTGAIPAPSSCTATTSAGNVGCTISGTTASPSPSPSTSTSPSASPSPSSTSSPTPTVTPSPLPASFKIAPYVDLSGWPTPILSSIKQATGISTYSLAFITSAGGCTPAWGGYSSLGLTSTGDQIDAMNTSISDLQAGGGDVLVSFGGANGSEVAQTCTDVTSLKNAYKAAVTKYHLSRIDFDIEGAAQGDRAANTRRGQAIAQLQTEQAAAGKPLTVTFTLPVLTTGLTADGLNVLDDTRNAGGRVDLVNVMAMDYGGANNAMGQAAIDAANATAVQITNLFPGTSLAQRFARVGVTPMIGANDVAGETFTLNDAKQLTAWTKSNPVGMVSWWSATRDLPCPNNGTYSSPTCSGTSNPPWAFALAFAA